MHESECTEVLLNVICSCELTRPPHLTRYVSVSSVVILLCDIVTAELSCRIFPCELSNYRHYSRLLVFTMTVSSSLLKVWQQGETTTFFLHFSLSSRVQCWCIQLTRILFSVWCHWTSVVLLYLLSSSHWYCRGGLSYIVIHSQR